MRSAFLRWRVRRPSNEKLISRITAKFAGVSAIIQLLPGMLSGSVARASGVAIMASMAQSTAAPTLLFRAGTVFTAADRDAVLRDAWVLVQDGRIASVSSEEPRVNGDVSRFDERDATLLPGLVDVHVHLVNSGSPNWLDEVKQPYAVSAWRAAEHARQTLLGGFTSIRDLGSLDGLVVALRDAQVSGLLPGPRIRAANQLVTMTGGHGHWMGRQADGPDEVRKAVREQLKAGADCVKLMATGGVMTPGVEPGAQQFTYEELKAGVEEAHKAGRKTASHAQGSDGIKAAVLAGIDSIEHGFYMTGEIIELMKERGTCFSVTLAAAGGIADAPPNTVPEWARAKAVRVRDAHVDSFRRAYASGVKIVLGTDAGTPYNHHGENAQELSLMVKYGMTPLDGLRAATRNGAELLDLGEEIGTIEAGKAADLVLCRGDATQNVDLLCDRANLLAVVQAGKVVARST